MKRKHIHNPPDFNTIEGKLKVNSESLDGLLDATERFIEDKDIIDLLAALTASVVITHQLLEQMLSEQQGADDN